MNRMIGVIVSLMIGFWLMFPALPCDAENWFKKGLTLLDEKKYTEAIEAFSMSLEVVPDDYEAYNNRGIAWFHTGNYDRAIYDYTRALELRPRYPKAFYNRGAAWFSKGQYINAVMDCMSILEINNDDHDAAKQMALILAAYTGKETLYITDARMRARKEIESTKDADFLDALAAVYIKAEKIPEAIVAQERAVSLLKKKRKSRKRNAFVRRLKYYRAKMTVLNKPVRILKKKDAVSGLSKGGQETKIKHVKISKRAGADLKTKHPSVVLSEKAFSIQVGAYLDMHNAEKMVAFLKTKEYNPVIFTKTDARGNTWYNVRIGMYRNRREAMNAGTKFYAKEKITTIVRPAGDL